MNWHGCLTAGLLLLSAGLQAQETASEIYQIDLVLNGQAFALDKPTLQGDTYVFRSWPEGTSVRLRKANVRKITPWTKKPAEEIAYQIDVIPSGQVLARDKPTLKGNTYVFRTSRNGTLMSVRQADVRKITRLTGARAFWAEQSMNGEVQIGNLAMQGGSSQAGPSNLSAAGPRSGGSGIGAPTNSNWIYAGTPGVSDAYAPASATISSPGGVPQLPAATAGSPPPH